MIASATTIGRTHRLMAQNRQDVACGEQTDNGMAFGLVLDGCGAKLRTGGGRQPSRNEVGALLLCQHLSTVMRRQLVSDASFSEIAGELSRESERFLTAVRAVVSPEPIDAAAFVTTHLLCTVVGFAVSPEAALVFWAGDGAVLVNDEVYLLDAGNRPDYPGYALLDGHSRPFSAFQIWDRAGLKRLALATDGWSPADLVALPDPCSSLLLQRWLNRQTGKPGRFEDDGGVVVWWAEDGEDTR